MSALQLIEINSKGDTLALDPKDLELILNHDEIRDRSLVVISIAGAMRKGKSFMLNWFLRYLESNYTDKHSFQNWLGNPDEKLNGFSWCGGSKRNTTGVLVWSEIFCYDYTDGRKVAILLLDTQGSFDAKTRFDGFVSIFSLTTILSSVQIYNLTNNIQQNDLQYLSLFLDYGKAALKGPRNEKPFQKLFFLIRDWSYPYEAPFGLDGGNKFLQKTFSTCEESENIEIYENIESCFEETSGFLMPYPGKKVATDPNFQGCIRDIEPEFIKYLKELIPNILHPEKLKVKYINGTEMKARHFIDYARTYLKILTSGTLPNPKTIATATAEAQNLVALSDAKEFYLNSMEKAMSSGKYLDHYELTNLHDIFEEQTQKKYEKSPKISNAEKSLEDYKTDLENTLEKNFYYFMIKNEKNRPDSNEELQELIDAITSQKELAEHLNQENTKAILDLINTVRNSQEQNQQQIKQLIEEFRKSPKEGLGFMNVVMKIINIIPVIIQTIFSVKSGKPLTAMK